MDSKIKNVVFDLGGVLINLDFDNCLNACRKAGFQDIEKQVCQFKGKGFFSLFELGEISPEEFRSAIRKEEMCIRDRSCSLCIISLYVLTKCCKAALMILIVPSLSIT